MQSTRYERLNRLAKINNAKAYLEVGVNKGETFLRVDIPYKVAVDPLFLFETKSFANEQTVFYQMTSDEFFSRYAVKHNFDLIYLDGLHTFEQTLRDFLASLKYSHPQTIWLIDDTHPISFLSCHPNLERVRKLRQLIPGEGLAWMGDVFKVIFMIHDFFPQFNFATFSNHGQTAIWQETRQDFSPMFNSLERISRLGYDDFLELKDPLLRIMDEQILFSLIENSFTKSHH